MAFRFILILLFFSQLLMASESADSLETILNQTSGNKKLVLLLELTGKYKSSNANLCIKYGEAALLLGDSLLNDSAVAKAHLDLGEAFKLTGNFPEAIHHTDEAMKLYKKKGNNEKVMVSINQLGLIYQQKNDLEKANEYYNQVLREINRILIDDPENENFQKYYLTAQNNIGLILILKENYDSAGQYYNKLLLEIDSSDFENQQNILGNLGYIYSKSGEYDKALVTTERLLSISRQLKDKNIEARALMQIGNMYYYKGDNLKALDFYKQSYDLNNQVGNKTTGAWCANNIASVYERMGDYENAVIYFQKSLSIKEDLNDLTGIANTLGNIGLVYSEWKNYESADEYFRKSLKISLNKHIKEDVAKQCINLANNFLSMEKIDSALSYYQTANQYIDSIQDRRLKVEALNGLGLVYSEKKQDFNTAIGYLKKASLLARELGSDYLIANTDLALGKAYFNSGSFPTAKSYLRNALFYAKSSQSHDIKIDALLFMSKLYEATGDIGKSLKTIQEYIKVKDSVFNSENTEIIANLQTRYETEKKEKENIELKKNNEIQGITLKKKRNLINFMAIGISLISLLMIFIFFLYRNKSIALKNLVTKNLELARCDRVVLEKGNFVPEQVYEQVQDSETSDLQKELELINRFNTYLSEEKPYLYGRITIEDFCSPLSTNRTYLSKAINSVYRKSFSTIINEMRVRAARQMLADRKFAHISVEGIGEMAGYASRVVFYKNFKKITGLSPSYFRDSIKTQL